MPDIFFFGEALVLLNHCQIKTFIAKKTQQNFVLVIYLEELGYWSLTILEAIETY